MFKRKNTFYINKNYRRKTDDLKILILPIIKINKWLAYIYISNIIISYFKRRMASFIKIGVLTKTYAKLKFFA